MSSGSVGLVGSSGSRCPAGVFCPAGSGTTVTCPAGYYCPEGVITPMLVPNGSYSLAGASMPTPCPLGFYSDETTMPINTAGLREPSLSICATCSSSTGYQCSVCPTGTTTIGKGTSSVAKCYPFSYFCPAGTYNSTMWTLGTTLLSLDVNTLEVQTPYTMVEAISSDATYYVKGTSGVMGNTPDICNTCPAGSYCYGINYAPQLCNAGFYCPAGSSSPSMSYIAGKYCPYNNSISGYPSVLGLSEPSTCPAGTYSYYGQIYDRARVGCAPCPAGYYCSANTDSPSGIPQAYSSSTVYPISSQVIYNNNTYTMVKLAPGAGYGPDLYDGLTISYDKIWKNNSTNISYTTTNIQTWSSTVGYSGPDKHTILDDAYHGDKVTYSGRVYISRNSANYVNYVPSLTSSLWSLYQLPIDTAVTGSGSSSGSGSSYSIFPVACPLGFYCPAGTGPPGSTYTLPPGPVSGSGSTRAAGENISPIPCVAGSYCPAISSSLIPCPAGYYCPASGGSTYILCPRGYYCPVGTVTPRVCQPGTYCMAGSTEETPCPAGYYCPSNGSSGSGGSTSMSIQCPAGYYCPGKNITPLLCPIGYFCPLGSSAGTPCPAGYYCPPTGSSGSSGSGGIVPTSVICPIGYYCPGTTSAPIACPPGDVCLTTGMSSPSLCPAGSYSTSSSATSCILCSIGTYSSNPGSGSCTPCPAGTYGNKAGMVSSTCSGVCLGGYFCGQGSTDKFGANTVYGSSTTQSLCPAGYYCAGGTRDPTSTTGSASSTLYVAPPPISCPTGYYCPAGTNSPSAGSQYSATQVYSLGNQVSYNGSIYSLIKIPPAAGYGPDLYDGLSGSYDKFWRNDSISTVYNSKIIPSWNSTMTYNGPTSGSAQDNAINGDIVAYNGTLYISRNSTNSVGQTPSLSSSYWRVYTKPIETDASTSGSGSASTSLMPFYDASTIYTLNSSVFYNNKTYTLIKSPPGAGYGPDLYSGMTASYDKFWQDNDTVGKYTTTAVSAWDSGTYYSGPDKGSPTDDAYHGDRVIYSGRVYIARNSSYYYGYNPVTSPNMWSYYPLPLDTLNPGATLTTPTVAGSSSYTIKLPLACTAGSYCPVGTITPIGCTAGNYCPAGASSQTPCSLGNYCPAGSTSQTQCPAGSYCPTVTTQTECTAGNYCPAGSRSQTLCQAGSYCTTPSTSQQCPAGSYCPSGTVSPTQCPIGTYCVAGSSSTTACSTGSYCPAGSVANTPCPAGSYCTSPSTKTLCSSTYYCAPGSISQTLCPAGSYCTTAATSQQCPAGSYCPAGTVTPIPCPSGKTCDAGVSVPADPPEYSSSKVYSVGELVTYNNSTYSMIKAAPGAGYGPNRYDGLTGGYDIFWQNIATVGLYNTRAIKGNWNASTGYSGDDRNNSNIIYSGPPTGDLVSRNGSIYMAHNANNYREYDPADPDRGFQIWMPYMAPLLTPK
jgi:hypothetical protein